MNTITSFELKLRALPNPKLFGHSRFRHPRRLTNFITPSKSRLTGNTHIYTFSKSLIAHLITPRLDLGVLEPLLVERVSVLIPLIRTSVPWSARWDGGESFKSHEKTLRDVFENDQYKDKFLQYRYDFGDEWEHSIMLIGRANDSSPPTSFNACQVKADLQ